jgi:bifunctional DNA-binding transcriptional regulator/antitoxin component of YhaV-PrlF toxin-antitoxin module
MIGTPRKVDELGRVVLPMEVRKMLGLEVGDVLFVAILEVEGVPRICLEPAAWLLNPEAVPSVQDFLDRLDLHSDNRKPYQRRKTAPPPNAD